MNIKVGELFDFSEKRRGEYMLDIIKEQGLIEKKQKLLTYINVVLILLAVFVISNVIGFKEYDSMSYLDSTLVIIRIFSGILSILAFISCLVLYTSSKKESIFIITLMYLGLSLSVILGYIDHFQFRTGEFVASDYMTISTVTLRIVFLLMALQKNNRLTKWLVKNEGKAITFVIAYSLIFGALEIRTGITSIFTTKLIGIYSIISMILYLIVSIVLFFKALKEKEYSFTVLSGGLFMLGIRQIYIMRDINIGIFDTRLTSSITACISFGIIIFGSFAELYLYICRSKILNERLKTFYNLVDNNEHNYMLIYNENGISYANKKVKEKYINDDKENLEKLKDIMESKSKNANRKKEIQEAFEVNKTWKGIIKSESYDEIVDCSIQLINVGEEKSKVLVTYKDIYDDIKKELELERLRIYDREKSEFIYNLSHELRTPLNIFYSTIQLFDKVSENPNIDCRSVYNKYKKTLDLNCKRMLRLTNNIMDVSKIDSGILKPKYSNYNIVAIVEDITLSTVRYALSKGINIQFDTNEEECFIKCDSTMIERVILNLLSNAIKFSNENKNIYVDVVVNDEFVEIYVKDEGIGIPKEAQKVIFKKFIKNDQSFNRANEGSGIGLSVVKAIVDIHGGFIDVESKLEEGTTFKISLPNKYITEEEFKIYDIDVNNIELEFSDIYGIDL